MSLSFITELEELGEVLVCKACGSPERLVQKKTFWAEDTMYVSRLVCKDARACNRRIREVLQLKRVSD